ncbi:MAG: hypothetical protein L3K04_05540 [Thermoplasmata archaeon]|nr:hypothetical protein [Thermoplasmata archaeon]
MPPTPWSELAPLLEEERAFVYGFGGYGLELRGGTLVTNERIAVPSFNFVQDLRLTPGRLAGFLERALDHYFQRAIRPELRVRESTVPLVRGVLEQLGFRERAEPRTVHRRRAGHRDDPASSQLEVRVARPQELARVEEFWTAEGSSDRAEFHRALDVALAHPAAEEEWLPILAFDRSGPVSSALAHRLHGTWGIHGLATRPAARGRGAASLTLLGTIAQCLPEPPRPVALWADSDRLRPRLERLGFEELARYCIFTLPPEAELAAPPVAPTPGPRWRPPRGSG